VAVMQVTCVSAANCEQYDAEDGCTHAPAMYAMRSCRSDQLLCPPHRTCGMHPYVDADAAAVAANTTDCRHTSSLRHATDVAAPASTAGIEPTVPHQNISLLLVQLLPTQSQLQLPLPPACAAPCGSILLTKPATSPPAIAHHSVNTYCSGGRPGTTLQPSGLSRHSISADMAPSTAVESPCVVVPNSQTRAKQQQDMRSAGDHPAAVQRGALLFAAVMACNGVFCCRHSSSRWCNVCRTSSLCTRADIHMGAS
jgi:hypothetical protein